MIGKRFESVFSFFFTKSFQILVFLVLKVYVYCGFIPKIFQEILSEKKFLIVGLSIKKKRKIFLHSTLILQTVRDSLVEPDSGTYTPPTSLRSRHEN